MLEEIELVDQHVPAILRLQSTGKANAIATGEPLRALARVASKGCHLDVDHAGLRLATALAPLNGQTHTAFVPTGSG